MITKITKSNNTNAQTTSLKTLTEIVGKATPEEVFKDKDLLKKVIQNLKEAVTNKKLPDAIQELGRLGFSFEAVAELFGVKRNIPKSINFITWADPPYSTMLPRMMILLT